MNWHRLKLSIIAAATVFLILIAAGTAALIDRGERAATRVAMAALELSGRAVENALNRQLLQVHGALASLPRLFEAAGVSPQTPAIPSALLQGLNFQTLAYRDLLLVAPDGTILASARGRGDGVALPFDAALLGQEPTALIGPVRNRATGEWSVYVARANPGWNGVTALAEVPLRTLMELLGETGVHPRVRVELDRPDGRLIAALPHDEAGTGHPSPVGLGAVAADGVATVVTTEAGQALAVVRTSLFDQIRVALLAPRDVILAGWRLDRERILAAAAAAALLVVAFAVVLMLALRQRELAERERARAATMLVDAIDAMSDGFAMWDAEDRLLTCNQRYHELYARGAHLLTPGARFEDVVRAGVSLGLYADVGADVEAFVAAMVAHHRQATGAMERQLADGRWVLMKERRTPDGGIVGIRTDITALKTTLAELAEANIRANAAIAEAQRQNATLSEREATIRFLAHHDDLTGLPNRIQFRQRIAAALGAAEKTPGILALLYLDLDRFKEINDTLGHPVGDALLRAVAERLRRYNRGASFVARLGGDEFALVSTVSDGAGAIERLSTDVIARLSEPYGIAGHTISITASIGIAVADDAQADADEMLIQADVALYRAKAKGRGAYCVFAPGMDDHLHDRLDLEADLRRALDERQLTLVYQPVFRLATGELTGFEALLRWRHPERGYVSPATFIPLAEDTGLIVEIGAYVLNQVCEDMARLPSPLTIAMNLSPVEFTLGKTVEAVKRALEEHRITPGRFELEITETALFGDDQRNIDALTMLRKAGARIVLDDFGTGYSSLSHLHRFPLDRVKIDRSFVQDMTERADSAAIVESIATLARRLGITTTAEGIETAEQRDAARLAGCTEAQGYFLGVPKPLAEALLLAGCAADSAPTG
jgi:diguanylate cyclase (GGDEF)-like protein